MAVGAASSTVEIEFTSGTWTDVTAYLAYEQGMTGTFGRSSEFDDVSQGTWSCTLRNDDGRFTPNNPLSPYYPNVVENVRLRVTVTPPGGSASVRFLGYVTNWQPTFPDGDGYVGEVTVEAADLLAVMQRRGMRTGYVEQACYLARYAGSWCDTWTFDGSISPTVFENLGEIGSRTASAIGTAQIVTAASGTGAWQVMTSDDVITDAALSLAPVGVVGPVLKVVPGGTIGQLEFFVKIPPTGIVPGASFGTGVSQVIADFFGGPGNLELFSLRLLGVTHGSTSSVDLAVYNGGGTVDNVLGLTQSLSMDQDVWHKITLYESGGNMLVNVDDSSLQAPFGYDIGQVTSIYFGGYIANATTSKQQPGKQTLCPTMAIAGIDIQGGQTGVYGYYAYGAQPATTATQRYRELVGYGSKLYPWRVIKDMVCTTGSPVITSSTAYFTSDDVGRGINTASEFSRDVVISSVQPPFQATLSSNALVTRVTADKAAAVIGPAMIGTDDRAVVRVNTSGMTLAEAMQTNARTIGGTMWISNAGVPTMLLADAMRPKTPIATVSIEDDCIGPDLQLRRAIDQVPTRVTVDSPIGTAVVVDAVAEGLGYRREMSVSTGCATYADLAALGNFYLASSKALRVTQVTVDLAGSVNNLWASFLTGLRPGVRVRLTGLPSSVLGYSYVDVYVQGWREFYSATDALLTFDCSPADSPVEGMIEDAEYGRFAAGGTLDLAYPVTASATSLTVVPGVALPTPVMTTSAADYPLDVDLSGERVTLAAAPSTGSRTNLVTNPSFELGTTGWSASGTTVPTIAASTVKAYQGAQSLGVTWPVSASGASSAGYAAAGLTIGQTYTFSVYAYVPAGSPRVRVTVGGSPTGVTTIARDTGTTKSAWVRLAISFTAVSASHTLFVVTDEAVAATGLACFLDGVLLEAGTAGLGSYFDGSFGGSWTGTAHASTSTQATQVFTGATRGVSPTVARAHGAGEDVDIFHASAFAF